MESGKSLYIIEVVTFKSFPTYKYIIVILIYYNLNIEEFIVNYALYYVKQQSLTSSKRLSHLLYAHHYVFLCIQLIM